MADNAVRKEYDSRGPDASAREHAAKAMKIVLEDMRAGTFALRDKGMSFEEFKSVVHYDRWERIDDLYGRRENPSS